MGKFLGGWLIVWILFAIGWLANIFQVFSGIPATFGEATPMWLVKLVCIFFAPAGSVLGWIGMF